VDFLREKVEVGEGLEKNGKNARRGRKSKLRGGEGWKKCGSFGGTEGFGKKEREIRGQRKENGPLGGAVVRKVRDAAGGSAHREKKTWGLKDGEGGLATKKTRGEQA